MWRQDTRQVAQPRAKVSRAGVRWGLEALVCHLPWITHALAVPGTPLTLRSWKRAGAYWSTPPTGLQTWA